MPTSPTPRSRRIFVAYPYAFPEQDYRRPFQALEKAFDVRFDYADQQISSSQILQKITAMIMEARFSLFDVTRWNPNVALELGIAMGANRDYYLLFNPTDALNPKAGDVASDLSGFERLHYRSYHELEERLTKLLIQEFGVPRTEATPDDPAAECRVRVPLMLAKQPGLKIGEIAQELNVTTEFARIIVDPLRTAGVLETTGVKKGTRYYLPGTVTAAR
jgi:hypothetical protein